MPIIGAVRETTLGRGSRPVTTPPRGRPRYGQRVPGLAVDGKELQAGVFDENEVRAAAGLTMVIGAVAFSYAYFRHQYVPLQAVASFFFVEFLIRVTVGLQYSATGIVAHAITRRLPPQWVSAKPKRFAWTLGLGMGLAMTIITNSGIRGYLPRTICLICLALMWMETALGMCLGCEIHGLLARRGRAVKGPGFEVCANGACDVPSRVAGPESRPRPGRTETLCEPLLLARPRRGPCPGGQPGHGGAPGKGPPEGRGPPP
jgi:hypothetical protein